MLLEMSMFFKRPLPEFWYHSRSHFLFTSLCYFLHSIYTGECAEQNALGLRSRSLMVLDMSMFF